MTKADLLEKRDELIAWAKANPALAAIFGAGGFLVIVLFIVIISLVGGSGPSKKDLAQVDTDPSICNRLDKLKKMQGGDKAAISTGYIASLSKAYKDLTHEDASPQDAIALLSTPCAGLSNDDIAWRVQVDTRLRRGMWPSFPALPPKDPQVQTELRGVLPLSSRLSPAIASDVATRSAWLRFAVEGGNTDSVVLAQFYKKEQPQADDLLLYDELIRMGDKAEWLAATIQDKLSLLPEPLYVVEKGQGETMLKFMGVLEGEKCAIAKGEGKHPAFTVRPCTGLVPRRLAQGELFLVGAAAPIDTESPVHWLPLLVDDRGDVFYGTKLTIDPRVLGAFMLSAPRFQLGTKVLTPFSPEPGVAMARTGEGDTFPSFKTTAQGRPTLLAFSAKAQVTNSSGKKCIKIDAKRCDAIRGDDPSHKCTLEPPQCFVLPSDTEIRTTGVSINRPELCMKEYGEKTQCPANITTGLFIDVRHADESEFSNGGFIELFTGHRD